MNISEILLPNLVIANDVVDINKKKILERVAETLNEANPEVKYQTILEALQQRERIGSTTMGHGIALPHARLEEIKTPTSVLITMKNAIYFDEEDRIVVDIIWALFVPADGADQHVNILSNLATKLKEKSYREHLRAAENSQALYRAATQN